MQLSGGDGNEADSEQTEGEEVIAGSSEMDEVDAYNASSENQELKSRVSELESIVGEQQAALLLEDDGLANLEKQLGEVDSSDTLTEGDLDQVDGYDDFAEESDIDQSLADDKSVDDVWNSADTVAEDDTDAGMYDDNVDAVVEDLAAVDESSNITKIEPVKPVAPADQPWYSQAMDWLMTNILWVIIGLVVLLVLVLIPRFFNRSEEVADGGSFLDDIKSSRRNETDDIEEADDAEEADGFMAEDDKTVITKAVSADEVDVESEDYDVDFDTSISESEDDDDDVLANLDSSLRFGEDRKTNEDDEDVFNFDFDDDKDDVVEVTVTDSEDDADDSFVDGTPTKQYDPRPFMVADDVTKDDSDDDDKFSLDDLEDLDETDSELDDDFDGTFDLEDELEELIKDDTDKIKLSSADEDTVFDEDDFLSEFDDLESLDDDLADTLTTESAIDDESTESTFDDILSLDDQDEDEEGTAAFGADEDDEVNESIDLGLDDLMGDGDVIETKMDLAKAYIEMGDTEGAKNLLAEVVSEGDADQVNIAKKLLDEM